MRGFFTREEIQAKASIHIELTEADCLTCGLYRTVTTPKMKWHGVGKLKALAVAEGPGGAEDKYGKQLMGATGNFFKGKLADRGFDLIRDFWRTNAINCRPTSTNKDGVVSNRTPSSKEIDCCRPMLFKTISDLQPKFIWLMGGAAVESLLGHDFGNTSIGRWRNTFIPDQKHKAWLTPIYHPSYPNRDVRNTNLNAIYNHDLDRATRFIGEQSQEEFPFYDNGINQVKILTDFNEIINMLGVVNHSDLVVIDYETTGIKPYIPGHRIASVAITTSVFTISFPFEYASFFSLQQRNKIREALVKIWQNKKIKKVAHNAKFEHIWTTNIIGAQPVNWHWCTLQGAHIQDNRQAWNKLKFQIYVNFGIRPWGKDVEPYLNSHGKPFNTIDKCPIQTLLLYGGLDSYWTYRLLRKQEAFYNEPQNKGLRNAFDLFNEGSIVLAEVQDNGVHVDEEYCHAEQKRYRKRIKVIENQLLNSEEADRFKEKTGRKLEIKEKDFSDHDLRILLYEVLGYETDKKTEKSKAKSVDEETLRHLGSPFVDLVLKRRKFRKIEGTYLGQFIRETYYGVMHPFFDLIVPVSYRGSANNPNFQNIPVRDEQAKKATRRAIVPSLGNQLLESDFSGIEVGINACYNHDPTLVAEVTDPNADMHRDTAADIWKIIIEEVHKDLRFYSKSQMVFPEFYGSWYDQCAKNLWRTAKKEKLKTNSGIEVIKHLQRKGIITLDHFIAHIKEVERVFWNERFQVYAQWKKDIQKVYRKQGYIETFLGFRFQTYMTFNECTNYPAQGTAFHILLWTLIQVHKEIKKRGMLSKIIGQIHDSMVIDAVPSEVKKLIQLIDYWGTVMTRKTFEWITVPLKIDHEIAPINLSWYEKKEIK